MLLGHQPDPGRETAARRECRPIRYLGDQGGGDDRANAGNFLQPAAFFTRPVPSMDMFLDRSNLGRDNGILPSKNGEAQPRSRWNAIILLVSNDLEQLGRAIAALRRDNAELRHMPSD